MAEGEIHIRGLTPSHVALMKNVAAEAAEQTVRKFSIAMGLDPDKPLEAQEGFAALRQLRTPESIADRLWTRKTRQRAEGIVGKVVMTIVGAGVLGFVHSAWAGVRGMLLGGSPGGH